MSLLSTVPELANRPGELASSNAFLNALLREWVQWQHHPICPFSLNFSLNQSNGQADAKGGILLSLADHQLSVWLPLVHYSVVGRHIFSLPLWLVSKSDSKIVRNCGLLELAALVASDTVIGGQRSTNRGSWLFLKRVADSAINLADAEVAREKDMHQLAWPKAGYLDAEQGLIYGHPVHPTPKSRDEFSSAEVRAYGPEFASMFSLEWLALSPDAVWSVDCEEQSAQQRLSGLLANDLELRDAVAQANIPPNWILLPVHPWQTRVLRHCPAYQHWQRAGKLKELGVLGQKWYPTSSVRALFAPNEQYMLKHSLSVRLTNSTRVLQQSEVARGALVYGAFMSPLGQQLSKRCPTLTILHERAAFALANPAGGPLIESFVLLRDNPFKAHDKAYVMATLCQDGLNGAPGMLGKLIQTLAKREQQPLSDVARQWFNRFLEVALRPFLIAMSDFGFLFSAHQQNIILGLDNGYPSCVYFRDCQGTTFTPDTIQQLQPYVPGIEAACELRFNQTEINRLYGYYLIVNNVFNVISALGIAGVANEAQLVADLRQFLVQLKVQGLNNPAFVDYLLNSAQIESKGNFMICLRNVNETIELDGSFSSYVPMSNPIFHHAEL